jgi:drug/metabolite transporter (DMT)-like permease
MRIAAVVMMAMVMLFTRRAFRLPLDQMAVVAILAILYATTAILLVESYKCIPSGIATTIHFLYPLAVTLTMSWVFKERISSTIYIAVALSLVGVALLAWGNHTEGDFRRGVSFALLTVVTYAAYIVGVMRSRASRVDSIVLTFYVLAFGALLFFVYAMATSGIEAVHSAASWRDLIILALLCTVLSDYTLILAIKRIGSTRTSILGSMEPLTAVVVGVLYFGERIDTTSVVGLLLVICAVVVVIVQSAPWEE